MTFEEYQKIAKSFAVYQEAGTGSLKAILYNALKLGEAGEVQGKIGNLFFRDSDELAIHDRSKKAVIAYELGDLLWHLSQLADELNFSLSDIAVMNINKLTDRQARGVLKGSGGER